MSGFHGNHAAQLLNHLVCPELIDADARAQQTFFLVNGSYVVAGETCLLPGLCHLSHSEAPRVCSVKVSQFG